MKSSQSIPMTALTERGARRRLRVGFKVVGENMGGRSIDEACNDFFRRRGMKVGMREIIYGSKEVER